MKTLALITGGFLALGQLAAAASQGMQAENSTGNSTFTLIATNRTSDASVTIYANVVVDSRFGVVMDLTGNYTSHNVAPPTWIYDGTLNTVWLDPGVGRALTQFLKIDDSNYGKWELASSGDPTTFQMGFVNLEIYGNEPSNDFDRTITPHNETGTSFANLYHCANATIGGDALYSSNGPPLAGCIGGYSNVILGDFKLTAV